MRKRNLLLVAGACLATLALTVGSAVADPNGDAQPTPPAGTTNPGSETYPVSAACGRNYEPNAVWVDGDVTKPVSLTAGQLQALPGQQTLNISYLNHLDALQHFSETGPTLWSVLSIATGGLKVPPPTPNQYAGPSPQTTLYILVIGTDGYQTAVAEGDIDPGFSNEPILLAYAENGVPLSKVPYSATENKGPAQLVVPNDIHGGRYANQICRIKVVNGAI